MSRDDKGLFRGSEFPKLLVLGAMIFLGWPLVIYYGFLNKGPDKPANAPIAELPKLPPPDQSPEFRGVIDKEGRVNRDDAPIALLFKKVRENPDKLADEARREVLPIDLLMSSWRYRGLPIRMEGFAQQIYAHDGEDTALTPGGRFYEVWFRSDQAKQGTYPCCVFVEDVPKTLPGGRNLEERVALEGYFLKLYKYRAGDTLRFAPLLIGRITHLPKADPPSRQFTTKQLVTWLMVLLFVYISFRAFFAIRKTIVRPPTTWSKPADQIEPGALQNWLAEPEVEGEDTGR